MTIVDPYDQIELDGDSHAASAGVNSTRICIGRVC